jgi:hypothetical protein
MFQNGRLSLRRVMRTLAFRAIHAGLGEVLADGLSVVDRRRGLFLRGQIAGIRSRYEDHTDFWKAALAVYPNDRAFTRNKIDAALRAGRTIEAESGLKSLIDLRSTCISDCKFVVGLSQIDQSSGNQRLIRPRLKRFFGSLRRTADRRIAAVKLIRLIYANFNLKHPDGLAAERERYRERFLALLRRSDVKSKPKAILERVAACEKRLASAAPIALFDTDVSIAQCREFIGLVHARLAANEPFSFVRIGDGEAACIPYEPHLASLAKADAMERERIWWGKPLSAAVRERLTREISRAIWNADCIGIPATSRFLRELRLTEQDSLEDKLTGRGLRAILYATERFEQMRSPGRPAPAFTSCHLHQDLARWNVYGELFEGTKDIVLVSCHVSLADYISDRFRVSIKANVVLPPDRVSAPAMQARAVGELPLMMDEIIEKIGDLPRNRLVLIGAGYPGKWLVDVARARGGVALDLGSIFDYWLGLNTRSYLDLIPT